MVAIIGFVAFSIDLGMIALTKAQLQTAADAAALAASQEIMSAVRAAGENQQQVNVDGDSPAVSAAKAKAVEVAAANGVFVNPDTDVTFGKRYYDEPSNKWPIVWNEGPYNVVKVKARRDQEDTSAPDGKLKLAFAWIFGQKDAEITAEASAFVEARDIVMVLDYSASMNDDSCFQSISTIGQSNIEANLNQIYADIGSPNVGTLPTTPAYFVQSGQPASGSTIPHIDVTWKATSVAVSSTMALTTVILKFSNGREQRFSSLSGRTGEFAGTGTNAGKRIDVAWVKSGSNSTTSPGTSYSSSNYGERFEDTTGRIKTYFGLNSVTYPYPSGSWDDFINYVKNDADVVAAGYQKKYSKMAFVNYLLDTKPRFSETPVLWKGHAYPVTSLKDGCSLFCDFLGDLNFSDRLGLVIYDTTSRVEYGLSGIPGEPTVDLGDEPITYNYSDIDTIQRHKQAGHYNTTTAIGLGLKDGRTLLAQKGRYGAKPVIVLMTDGLANQYPSGWSLPPSWNWAAMTDLDGDGDADYSTTNRAVQYMLYEAKLAIDQGVVIHTLSVGAGADTAPMRCIASASGGTWIHVPGNSNVQAMREQLIAAFSEIAGKVPPPKLVTADE
jgi:Mg-chelatase subunit ChlD